MSPIPANTKEPNKDGDVEEGLTDAPQMIINGSDSESDGEDGEENNGGYQLLPQEPVANTATYIEDSASGDAENANDVDLSIMQAIDHQDMMFATPFQGDEAEELPPPSETVELWNMGTTNPSANEPMDPEHAEKIKSVMAGFVLPPSAQPAWAKHLSDDEWKQVLVKKSSSVNSSDLRKEGQCSKSDGLEKNTITER